MMRQLHTASDVERVYHLKLNGVKQRILSTEMYQAQVLLQRPNILIRLVIRRPALTACLNVNIALQ